MISKLKSPLLFSGVSTLALALAVGVFAVPGHAHAATSTADLEQQIQALQSELDDLKAAQAATQQQAVQAADNVNALSKDGSVVSFDLKKGMKLGKLTVKVGGFLAAEGVVRDKNEVGDIGSSFSSSQVPFRNSPNYHQSEYRGSARQSRLSLMLTGNPDPETKVTGYYEGDFLGAAVSANSKESNSYTPRIRQVWAAYERSDLGLHVFAGQTWTLATMEKKGMLPMAENAPLTIDASYVPGFTYLRNPEVRIVKDFDHTYWLGLALDNPQTIIGGTAPATVENAVNNGNGFGMQGSSLITYTNNIAPDVTLKFAADTKYGHYEVFGLGRFFEDRTTFPAAPAGQHQNATTVGGGVGFGALIPAIPDILDVQLSGLWGMGTGRYGSTQLPDVTYNKDGSFTPVENLQALVGVIGHVTPLIDVYGYAGLEQDHSTETAAGLGYGNNITGATGAGCMTEGGACTINYHRIEQATIGDWWKVYKGAAGTVQWGAQLSTTRFDAFKGLAAGGASPNTPHTFENQIYFSFRYYPFQ